MASQETTVLRDQTYRACHRLALLRALQGYYIIAGQEPAIAQKGAGANMSVDVGAFKYLYAGTFGEKTTTTNVVIEAADGSNARIDLVYLGAGGTITVLKGTAKAVKPVGETTWTKYEEPYPADLSGTAGIVLAEVLVPAGATTIVDAYIRNVAVTEALALYYASEAWGDLLYRDATTWARLAHGTEGQVLQTNGHGANPAWAGRMHVLMPGSPTRVSDTQFTVTDSGNANLYDKKFTKGTILQWMESTTLCSGMVISASYSSDAVTINLIGDSLSAGFELMTYCVHRAQKLEFILPGYLGVGTDLGRTHYADCDLIKLGVDVRVKVAGATNATTFDINDDGSTIITTKPSISNTGTSDLDNVCDAPTTVIAKDSAITLDVDAVTATPPQDAYVVLWVYPEAWSKML